MNRNYGRLENDYIAYAPDVIRIGDTYYCTPTAEQYIAAGWKSVNESAPIEPAPGGSHYEVDGWEVTDTSITRKWKIVEDPKIYRHFSKLKIYGAIAKLGAWNAIETWLRGKDVGGVNGWVAFELAQEITEDHPLFAAWADEARVLLGLTTEQFDALLNECILEG